MKGIVLAGGSGTRLYPLTLSVSKQILPVFDKPMIYYPISMLMLAGINEILIISTPNDVHTFENLFGDGKDFGLKLEYAVQEKPNGLPEAFKIGEDFIGDDSVCLILGDNVFYGGGMRQRLLEAHKKATLGIATIFGFYVSDPERFGVAEFDSSYKVLSIEEKPLNPKSNYAVTGMYFCDNKAIKYAKECLPSSRGETEILDVMRRYLENDKLTIEVLGRGYSWFDCGTHDSLAEASSFVRMIQSHQGMQLSCLEEIAYINGWLSKEQLLERSKKMGKSSYASHLLKVATGKIVY